MILEKNMEEEEMRRMIQEASDDEFTENEADYSVSNEENERDSNLSQEQTSESQILAEDEEKQIFL